MDRRTDRHGRDRRRGQGGGEAEPLRQVAHRNYLDALAHAAWQDATLTAEERADIGHVATLLGLTDTDAAINRAARAPGGRSPIPLFQLATRVPRRTDR